MAAARLSPAASVLRNSRLFSIPPTLNPPTSLTSDTATQPYPTHAAIETPPSSWDRGDWGFKRSLPLKSTTRTGTTTIRVRKGIDSAEHITDFESAGDHVLTLRKWKELNLPLRFMKKHNRDDNTSVFEAKLDNISSSASSTHRRWRYDGPWLAGQPGWEFDALLKRVRARKVEFKQYVRARLSTERTMSRRQEAIAAGQDLNEGRVGISDEDFDEHIRYLRATPSAFGPLIAEFLDLPEGPKGTEEAASPKDGFSYGRTTVAAETYSEAGPPRTHPSAGLSYYRSGAHISNHPTYGPQQFNAPVVARVLKPTIRRRMGDVGVAGFVIPPRSASLLLDTKPWQPVPGGLKMVVRPTTAAIGSDGRVMLIVLKAHEDLKKVYNIFPEDKPRDMSAVSKTRMASMPLLDEQRRTETKASREAEPSLDMLDKLMYANEDREHI
ncbi:hypothetical protein GJ744_004105 [Endocarpon pusillum]|uniref:Uncharacterized protein n=1 Tax=Endocarpon pusillum TaxID=364733 RepID=A0A8H7ANX5_9EURO|nr:hypothetical protein GJ744_004105 [Endocarpon pusillum]